MGNFMNNNFGDDTYSVRAERLNLIQGNFSTLQDELEAPQYIADWSDECYDIFSGLLSEYRVDTQEGETATINANQKGELMDEEYQNSKNLAIAIYSDNSYLNDFFFDRPYPDNRYERIARIDHVLKVNQRHVADGLETTLPTYIIDRLAEAHSDYISALRKQEDDKIEGRHKHRTMITRYAEDTKSLRTLRAWWFAKMGKEDPRIGLLGMVNPDQTSTNGKKLSAPTNLRYEYSNLTLKWNAVSGATSYQVEISDNNTDWTILYEGDNLEYQTNPMIPEHSYLRIRARNSNGLSNYSEIFNTVYALTLTQPQGLNYIANYPGYNWAEVPGALQYEVHYRNQSATEDDWYKIYFGNDNTLYHADSIGNFIFRVRAWNNTGTSAWSQLAYNVTA